MGIRRLTIILIIAGLQHGLSAQPDPPAGFQAAGYDSHIELSWFGNAEPDLGAYRLYRSENGADFAFLRSIGKLNTSAIDFVGAHGQAYAYMLTAVNTSGQESAFSDTVSAVTFEMTDEQLLGMVQQYTFRYFWDFAHPVSGMARERNTTSIVTSGGSGFGIMAIIVGMERGFISREAGVQRLLKIVAFLETADRFHGAWAHWMNGATGEAIPFSTFDDGGDLVETAFLVQGLLAARAYISGTTPGEIELRDRITALWETVEWNWYRKGVQEVLYWHWSPNFAWQMNFPLRGFNETHITYILAIASPTYPVPASLYHNGWAGGNLVNGNTYFGFPLQVGPYRGGPLFFSHYSYLGFDPRNIRDDYANYFVNNINHTRINRQYCIENPQNHTGYSDVCWGLTASDNPWGYLAHEPTAARDNGTITPTAALGSMPYTPDESIAALKHFYRDLGDRMWGEYGFYDAFNLNENWFASSYLAIDQGPIICMIENYRSGLLWDLFMQNPEIASSLDKIGFVADTTMTTGLLPTIKPAGEVKMFPNPASREVQIALDVDKQTTGSLRITDINGILWSEQSLALTPGKNHFTIDISHLENGVYLLHTQIESLVKLNKMMVVQAE